ncbi:MAG: hypothetical protein AABW51_01400 [Nanoarchaeota archaeon]
MKLRKADIGKTAKETLGFFEEHNIVSPSSFNGMFGHTYFFDTQKSIVIRRANSEHGTTAIGCEYWIQGVGNPLNIKINPSLSYYRIIVKSIDLIDGYNRFDESDFMNDIFGNIPQERTVKVKDIRALMSDLENLARLA